MKELTFNQVEDVNGAGPIVAGVVVVAAAIVVAGIISGYLDHVSQH